ncbi:hypothetical protein B0I27_105233 [Arcticibacter pallidicorallinus]|uniref:Uncharacterized protein n=1 Tax=Arcticibacter pallidicorallinus TaxID=1259464 RepID=A0A2T0U4F5_9SPHI|nr:hypothetical protein [Arcticibacter pallidicorallinus]PRY52764.1 hypothetical protein B0I27_105233 [Arcticibacter pallidicorallinus]
MNKKQKSRLIIFMLVILVASNYSPFRSWKWYYYSSADGNFTFGEFPEKGLNLKIMEREWAQYRLEQRPADSSIYRSFAINPLKFWLWKDYLFMTATSIRTKFGQIAY